MKNKAPIVRAAVFVAGVYSAFYILVELISRMVYRPSETPNIIDTIFGLTTGLGLFLVILLGFQIAYRVISRNRYKPASLAKRVVGALVIADILLFLVTGIVSLILEKILPSRAAAMLPNQQPESVPVGVIAASFLSLFMVYAFVKLMFYFLAKSRAEREQEALFS